MTVQGKQWHIQTSKPIHYTVRESGPVFHPQNRLLLSEGSSDRRVVVIDHHVLALHREAITTYFQTHGVTAEIIPFVAGEGHKTLEQVQRLIDKMDAFQVDRRREPVIAIGGGVLCDLVAFAASIYRRGVPHIKVPTTLMGYIDASIGIKSGVNANGYKNRLGTFEPPKQVILDKSFLKTLPEEELLNGFGEIIKIALIKDSALFSVLEAHGKDCLANHFQDEKSGEILTRAIEAMIEELQPNLYEEELARAVDFGHTFSPAFELQLNHPLKHGEAVVVDILLSCLLGFQKKIISQFDADRMTRFILQWPYPFENAQVTPEKLWHALSDKTYHRGGKQNIPMPPSIGACVFENSITFDDVTRLCDFYHTHILAKRAAHV